MQVSIGELKNHLSQYLRKVRVGVKVVVTSHRVPLAVINAIPDNTLGKMHQIEDLDMEWNGKKPKGYRKGPKILGKSAAERVLEDRR